MYGEVVGGGQASALTNTGTTRTTRHPLMGRDRLKHGRARSHKLLAAVETSPSKLHCLEDLYPRKLWLIS